MSIKDNSRVSRRPSLSALVANLPEMVYRCRTDELRTMEFVSDGCYPLTGYHAVDLRRNRAIAYGQLIHPEDRERIWSELQASTQSSAPYRLEYRLVTASGETKWVADEGRAVVSPSGATLALEGFCVDITAQKQAEEELRASEAGYRDLLDSLQDLVFEMGLDGRVIYGNQRAYDFFGLTSEDYARGLNALDSLAPEERERAAANIRRLMAGEDVGVSEYMAQRTDGSRFPVIVHSTVVRRGGRPVGLRGVIVDITERKHLEKKMEYLSLHDPLTGLHNRTYFEQEMHRLEAEGPAPIGVIVCDVDGLKLINDTLGHGEGDALLAAASSVLKGSVRKGDSVARIGGDEFAVLLSDCDQTAVVNLSQRIQDAVARYNAAHPELVLSISMGFAYSAAGASAGDLFKQADDNMYREKLHRGQSARSAIVQTLRKALEARDYITEGHAERLRSLVGRLATACGLPEHRVADMRLLAEFHDIGKVGIPDRILFKPGALTPNEVGEMRRHCEIGYRIAQSAPDLAPIGDWILKHHEWWNGEGYPLGLREEEIPFECRALAIADAYDAMTSDRPYRKAMPRQEAVAELVRFAGTQFDPALIERFLEILD